MPKRITPLSDTQIRRLKSTVKPYKLSDGGGLYLMVTPSGGKLWRYDYTFDAKRKTLTFGTYPEITLEEVRTCRADARKLLAHGTDPAEVKKAAVAAVAVHTANTLAVVAKEWHDSFASTWCEKHAHNKWKRTGYILDTLGQRPVAEITVMELVSTLKSTAKRHGLDVAHRTRNDCLQIYKYAIATGKATRNIAQDAQGALPPVQGGHHAAPTEPKALAAILQAIEVYEGSQQVQVALKLAPMLLCRPGELRGMEWSELNLDAGEWNIPAERMKMKAAHLVPLPSQAVTMLKELQPVTSYSRYCFPSVRTPLRPMSDNTVNAALRRMGFTKEEVVGHGFRATARTILDEVLQVRPDFIEHQLAHAVRDPNGRAYNRTAHLAERKIMMQQWADYLDGLK